MSLKDIINDANAFVKQQFNLSLDQSSLKVYTSREWSLFCEQNDFSKTANGLYVSSSNIAYVHSNSPYLISDIFHEYFGHGLFCEKSESGISLTKIIHSEESTIHFLNDEVDT